MDGVLLVVHNLTVHHSFSSVLWAELSRPSSSEVLFASVCDSTEHRRSHFCSCFNWQWSIPSRSSRRWASTLWEHSDVSTRSPSVMWPREPDRAETEASHLNSHRVCGFQSLAVDFPQWWVWYPLTGSISSLFPFIYRLCFQSDDIPTEAEWMINCVFWQLGFPGSAPCEGNFDLHLTDSPQEPPWATGSEYSSTTGDAFLKD